jgi:hypothetical protein
MWKETFNILIESIGYGTYTYQSYCSRSNIPEQSEDSIIKYEQGKRIIRLLATTGYAHDKPVRA